MLGVYNQIIVLLVQTNNKTGMEKYENILSSSSSQKRKLNEHGSLRISEKRFLILELYLRLLKIIKAQN